MTTSTPSWTDRLDEGQIIAFALAVLGPLVFAFGIWMGSLFPLRLDFPPTGPQSTQVVADEESSSQPPVPAVEAAQPPTAEGARPTGVAVERPAARLGDPRPLTAAPSPPPSAPVVGGGGDPTTTTPPAPPPPAVSAPEVSTERSTRESSTEPSETEPSRTETSETSIPETTTSETTTDETTSDETSPSSSSEDEPEDEPTGE